MAQYIDGFVFPIPLERLDDYKNLVEAVAKIWKEHGAIEYCESVADDPNFEGTRSFSELLVAEKNEVEVFGWVVFDSRETRDLAHQKVAADPRMTELVESSNSGFDATRMAYGGFRPLVQMPGPDDE